MEWINYHHLYYFWIIAKEGSITRAAKRLNLSQPTLSGQLKLFEDFVKKPVFQRKSRGLELNETGQTLFRYADSIFHLGTEMMSAVHRPQETTTLPLRVGIDGRLPKKILHKFLRRFTLANYFVIAETGLTENLVEKLATRSLECILTDTRPANLPAGCGITELEQSSYVFAAAAEWKSLKKDFPKSLDRKPVLLPKRENILSACEQQFKTWGISPVIAAQIDDSEILRISALESEAAVVVPRAAISDLIKRKELIILGDDLPLRHSMLVLTNDHKSQQSRELINILQK